MLKTSRALCYNLATIVHLYTPGDGGEKCYTMDTKDSVQSLQYASIQHFLNSFTLQGQAIDKEFK